MLSFSRENNVNIESTGRRREFEWAPNEINEMEHLCRNNFIWIPSERIEMFEDGKLLTQNDGFVEIYDQGFCRSIMRDAIYQPFDKLTFVEENSYALSTKAI